VVLTGEGADEALAGYPWFKIQKLRDLAPHTISDWFSSAMLRVLGRSAAVAPGVRTAQQMLFDVAGVTRSHFYSRAMWEILGGHVAQDDMGIDWERLRQWHPLNRSLYVGYKATLAGMQLFSKGDRVTMHSSVEARYPYLDEDVVEFCAGIAPEYKLRGLTEKSILRDVAKRMLPDRIARRPKTMFRAQLAPTFIGAGRPKWVDELLSAESLRRVGWFDPTLVARAATREFTFRRPILDFGLTSVIAVQLWHHLWCGGGLCELPSRAIAARTVTER
jgi:asparagine synthase (glutamine-hydrolysing)